MCEHKAHRGMGAVSSGVDGAHRLRGTVGALSLTQTRVP